MKHKTITKKLFAALLSCSMLASALTGCGNSDEDAGKSSESQTPTSSVEASATDKQEQSTEASAEEAFDPRGITEGVKLTVAAPEDTKIADYNTNETTLMIEEALGVDLEFITFPSADYESKLNVMVMSGETLPDIIFQPGNGYTNWIGEDALLELTEYYENPDYAANILNGAERCETDIQKYLSLADGKVYAIPKWTQDPGSEVSQKFWIYKPWLEALDLEVPETTEEFYEFCKLVAETDLNGNGKHDEIGLTGTGIGAWFDVLMSAFVYAHEGDVGSEFRVVEDGQVGFAFTTEEWKEGLKYIRKFFEEGLIPTETLTQSSDQYKTLLYSEEPVVGTFAAWCYDGTDVFRRNEYTYINALEGPDGEKRVMYKKSLPDVGAVISADCENPEAAFLVCDYMCSETISLTSRYGKQGEDWDYWEDTQVENPEAYGAQMEGYDMYFISYGGVLNGINFWSSTEPQSKSYRQIGPIIRDKGTVIGRAQLMETTTDEQRVKLENELLTWDSIMEAQAMADGEYYDYAPLTIEETESVADIQSAMKSYVTECTSAFLSGSKDIDAEWDAYLAELEKIGIDTLLETYQTAYDRVH